MAVKPWVISTLILAFLTLADWTGMKINITVGKTLGNPLTTQTSPVNSSVSSTVGSATASAQTSPAQVTTPTSSLPKLEVPSYDKSGGQKRTATELLASARAREIYQSFPKDGSKTPFGMTTTVTAQKELAKLDKSLPIPDGKKEAYGHLTGLGYHPCCDGMLQECDCEHAVAMRGLIKKYLAEGKSDDEIKGELVTWMKFWWPKHYVIMTLFNEAVGKKVSEQDLYGPAYGMIRYEKQALDYLLYQ